MLVPRLLHNFAKWNHSCYYTIYAVHIYARLAASMYRKCILSIFANIDKDSAMICRIVWLDRALIEKLGSKSINTRMRRRSPIRRAFFFGYLLLKWCETKQVASTPKWGWSNHNSHVDQVEGSGHSLYQPALRYNQHSSTHKSNKFRPV